MSLSREEIGTRLRHQREVLGFTQKHVAQSLGLHRPTISEIEAGRRDVTSQELFEFARLYVTSLNELLAEPAPSEENVTTVLFRRPGLETPDARRAVKKFMQRCREERELEELLAIDPPDGVRPSYRVEYPASTWDAVQQGENIARKERRRLGLGGEPMRNPIDLLEQQGVRIAPLNDNNDDGVDLDGIYFETEDLGACIAVNLRRDDRTGFRAAFTASHEYAHWLLGDVKVEEFNFYADERELHEVRANAFAAAFLMPEEGVRSYFGNVGLLREGKISELSLADIVRAMDYFGVSRQALLYRLQNLGLIATATAKDLRDRDWSARDVTSLARRLGLGLRRQEYISTRLPILAIDGWRRGLITTGRAADLLDQDIAEFKMLMSDLGEVREIPSDEPLLGAAAAD